MDVSFDEEGREAERGDDPVRRGPRYFLAAQANGAAAQPIEPDEEVERRRFFRTVARFSRLDCTGCPRPITTLPNFMTQFHGALLFAGILAGLPATVHCLRHPPHRSNSAIAPVRW